MFTGIVESVGTVVECGAGVHTRRLVVATTLPVGQMHVGASIAVDGVCLTLVERTTGTFAADLGPETLALTTLAALTPGDRVHLERPLAAGDPLGGHIVAGHVDGVGRLIAIDFRGEACDMRIAVPASLATYLVSKGSIAVDGVSLTVNTVDGDDCVFSVTLIPHTVAVTKLGQRRVGDAVNLEVDPIAKQVAIQVDRLMPLYVASSVPGGGGRRAT